LLSAKGVDARVKPAHDDGESIGAKLFRHASEAKQSLTPASRPAPALAALFLLQRLAHLLQFAGRRLVDLRKRRSSFSIAATIAEEITTRANHL